MIRVVFICTANICRSPMAEGLLRHHWKKWGQDQVTTGRRRLLVTSMGIQMISGEPASPHAVAVCAEAGVDISAHRSQALDSEELQRADLILTMTRSHKNHLQLLAPSIKDKIFMLTCWPRENPRRQSIPDPIGRSLQHYRKIFTLIDTHVTRIIPHLAL